MKPECCPTCGQPYKNEAVPLASLLSRVRQTSQSKVFYRIVCALWASPSDVHDAAAIAATVYAGERQPRNPKLAIQQVISSRRAELEPHGWKIRTQCGVGGGYRLERIKPRAARS